MNEGDANAHAASLHKDLMRESHLDANTVGSIAEVEGATVSAGYFPDLHTPPTGSISPLHPNAAV